MTKCGQTIFRVRIQLWGYHWFFSICTEMSYYLSALWSDTETQGGALHVMFVGFWTSLHIYRKTIDFTYFYKLNILNYVGGATLYWEQIQASTSLLAAVNLPSHLDISIYTTCPRELFFHLSECFNSILETKTRSTSNICPGSWLQPWNNLLFIGNLGWKYKIPSGKLT